VPNVIARLGFPPWLGLAIDWTFFDTVLPSAEKMRYQVLRIAVPRKGWALPLLQLAYNRDALPANKSQNQLEQEAGAFGRGSVASFRAFVRWSWPIGALGGLVSSLGFNATRSTTWCA
jgi:hypothetical protein